MRSDLVDRLRGRQTVLVNDIEIEAADAIEELQAKLARVEEIVEEETRFSGDADDGQVVRFSEYCADREGQFYFISAIGLTIRDKILKSLRSG